MMYSVHYKCGTLILTLAFLFYLSICQGRKNIGAHRLLKKRAAYTTFPTTTPKKVTFTTFGSTGAVVTSSPDTRVDYSATSKYQRSKSIEIVENACKGYSLNKYNFTTSKLDCYKVAQFIVGGTKAEEKEFPHMALIGYEVSGKVEWKCGGSLIHDRWVLSAAHCSSNAEFGDAKWVRLGELDLNKANQTNRQDLKIVKRITYDGYNPSTYYHDIVLFKTQCCAHFSAYVRPICLDTSSVIRVNSSAVITGWGNTEQYTAQSSNNLLRAVISTSAFQECDRFYSGDKEYPNGLHPDQLICAGDPQGKIASCYGDSGGPLQIPKQGEICVWMQIGITSHGPSSCADKKVRSVYGKVAYYIEWIQKKVWPQ